MDSEDAETKTPVHRHCSTADADGFDWHDDMLHAFETAADGIESECFGGANADRQNAAYREVGKRIRAMAKRYRAKHCP